MSITACKRLFLPGCVFTPAACRRGFRNALIWASVDNYRGQAFYSNFGFAVEEPPDWTHKFVKELPSPEPEPEPSSSDDY